MGEPPNIVWSRRQPWRLKLSCLARAGVSDSSVSYQQGRVGAAHTNRWAATSHQPLNHQIVANILVGDKKKHGGY